MRVIGMISGTSFDAIEAVATEIRLDKSEVVVRLLEHVSTPYPARLHDAIEAVLPPGATSVEEVCRLDTQIGQAFAEVAASLGEQHFGGATDVVCSHGQTVFHWVDDGQAKGTLQLGQGAWIAERTGATVVADVRSRDIAAGGHGAPLASLVDVLLLGRHPDRVRGALNLGGIANITVVGPDRDPSAFDIGPANALIDAAVRWLSDGRDSYDESGQRARRGTVDEALLAELLQDPYYEAPAPKSTGKEYFHLDYLLERVGPRRVEPDDLIATLTALAAETVTRTVRALGIEKVFASGGGTRNNTLMDELRRRSPDVEWSLIDELGVPEAAKEALLFALIGFLSVQGLVGTVASCTGATHSTVLGAIIPGRLAVTALSASDAPTSLRVVDATRERSVP